MAKPALLVLCLALGVAPAWGSSVAPSGTSEPPAGQTVAPTEDDTLQNEADNQENVLSQVGCGSHARPSRPGWGRSCTVVLVDALGGSCFSPAMPEGRAFAFHLSECFLK